MCEVQDRMLGARGMPEHIQMPHVDNLEALKAPVFFLWELLGYGTAIICIYVSIKKLNHWYRNHTMTKYVVYKLETTVF